MSKKFLLVLLLVVMTLFSDATELKRDGWNLISVCQDMNSSEIDMTGIEEIQSQSGETIYTGEWAEHSNLEMLNAGYGYWVKAQAGTIFDSRESSEMITIPLTRDGWNLMASCENIPSSDINLTELNISEVQAQDGKSIYTGEWAESSNLDMLENGYGYWVKGDRGTAWNSKRGVSIPAGFDYQTINNSGEIIETTFNDLIIKLFVDYNETANDQANHTGIIVRINGEDAPIMQIQDTYRGHPIVVGIYNLDGELIEVSDIVTVEVKGSGTIIDVQLGDTPPPTDIHPEINLFGEGIRVDGNQSETWWFDTRDVDSVYLAEGTPNFITLIEDNGGEPMSITNANLAQNSIPRGLKRNISANSEEYKNYRIEMNLTSNIPTGYYPIEVIGVNNQLGIEVNGTLNLFYGIDMPDIYFDDNSYPELNQNESKSINFTLYNADTVEIGDTIYYEGSREVVANFADINGNSIDIHPTTSVNSGWYDIELIVKDSTTGGEISRWIGVQVNPEGSNHRPDMNLTIINDLLDINSSGELIAIVDATDIDGDDVNISLGYHPSFIVLDNNNSIIYQPDGNETIGSRYDIEVYAEDSQGARTYREFMIIFPIEEGNQPVIGLKPLYTTDSRLNYEIYGEKDSTLFIDGNDTGIQLVDGSTMIDFAKNSGKVINLQLDINGEISDETNLTLVEYPSLNLNIDDSWSSKVASIHRVENEPAASSSSSKKTLVQASSEINSSHYSKYYYFTIENDKNVTIDLSSTTDTYLFLLNGFGKESSVITSNDDYEGTLNSHIEQYLEAGTYTIEATTFSSNQWGEFNLNVISRDINNSNNYIPFTDEKVADKTFYGERWYSEIDKESYLYSILFNSDYNSTEYWSHAQLDASDWNQSWEYQGDWHIDENGSLITKEDINTTLYTWEGDIYNCSYNEKYYLLEEFEDGYDVEHYLSFDNCIETNESNPTSNHANSITLSPKIQSKIIEIQKSNSYHKTEEEKISFEYNWRDRVFFAQPQPYTKDELRAEGYDDVSIGGEVEIRDINNTVLPIPTDAQVHIAHTWDSWNPALGLNALLFDNGDFNASEFLNVRDKYRDGQMMDYQIYIDSNHNGLFDNDEELLCQEQILFENLNQQFICQPDKNETKPTLDGGLPLIIIRIEFDDYQFRSSEAVWHDKIFGKEHGELNHYYNEISYGKFNFKEANESDGIANNGVITVHLNENHPGDVDDFVDRINSAVALADDYIDFSIYDKDNNGAISKDELQLMYLVSGGESATGVSPGIWAYQWCMYGGNANAPTHDGVKLMSCQDGGNFSRFGERQFSLDGPDASIGVIAHELGHAVFGLPDLYDIDYSSAGIGQFGLMSGGSWAKQPGDDYPGETPVHMTGWSKVYSGFVTPTEINETVSNLELKGTSLSDYVLYKIETGVVGEYFLIENRAPSGYDMGLSSLEGTDSFTGGLSILHIDDNQRGNSDENHKLVDIVEANNVGLDSKKHQGHINNLYFNGNADSFTPTTTPNSNRYDENSSGISITNISDAGSVMSVDIEINRGE